MLVEFIFILHVLLILFIIFTPFFGCNYFLLINSIIIPFIILHWILNNNTCCLTICENKLRNLCGDTNQSFTAQLFNPIYDFKKNHQNLTLISYIIMFIMWFISFNKLKKCTHFIDIFK